MIIGHHLIWTVYGVWLPNDPRGSSSHEIREGKLAPLGDLHFGRKRIQPPSSEIRSFYRSATPLLDRPRLLLTDDDIAFVATVFGRIIRQRNYTCHACAIMPDHLHLLMRRHRDKAEQMLFFLQEDTKQALLAADRRPPDHPVWGGPGWKVFKDRPEEMADCAHYIHDNPLKAGRPAQHWDFVVEYDGWVPRPWRK